MHYSFTDFTPGKTVVIYEHMRFSLLTDVIRALGYTIMAMTVLGIGGLFAPIAYQEISYRFGLPNQSVPVIAVTKQSFSDLIAASHTGIEVPEVIPADESFRIVIPKINVNSTVLPNVSASDPDEYLAALKQGVAHAKGTFLPGQGGTVFIFGHSTDYVWNVNFMNAQFYLLKELEKGDEVVVYYHGKRFIYTVTKKLITDPEDLSVLQPIQNGEKLVLQTCWPPGTAFRRYIIEAEPVKLVSK